MAPSYFIAKVYRHHTSSEVVIPQAVCIALGIKRGDHVVFQWNGSGDTFGFKKFVPVGAQDAGDTKHFNGEDQSRAAQTAFGG